MAAFRSRCGWACVLVLAACVGAGAVTARAEAQAAPVQTQPQTGDSAQDFAKTRKIADEVLSRREFQRDYTESWWDQKKRQLFELLAKLFGQMDRLGHAAPWLVRSLEWGLFLGAGAGLVVFLMRQVARQRLRIDLSTAGTNLEAWSRESSDWAEQAAGFAAEGAWRDAVHCLYWAAIVLLESRRAWRHNPTRTPREYVRLLKAGSAQQQGLRGLTQIFERSWYGLREVDVAEYTKAKELYDDLLTPRVESRQMGSERLEAERL